MQYDSVAIAERSHCPDLIESRRNTSATLAFKLRRSGKSGYELVQGEYSFLDKEITAEIGATLVHGAELSHVMPVRYFRDFLCDTQIHLVPRLLTWREREPGIRLDFLIPAGCRGDAH